MFLSLCYRLPIRLQDPVKRVDVKSLLPKRILAGPNHIPTPQSNFRYGDPPA